MRRMFLVQQVSTGAWQQYGLFILETMAALAVIALAGWAVVRLAGHRLIGGRRGGRMQVKERLVLEPRRSIHLVEVDGETLLIGTSEGSVRLLKAMGREGGDSGEADPGVEDGR